MTYELAVELKNAGFPQHEELLVFGDEKLSEITLKSLSHRRTGFHRTYDSSRGETLEELRSKPASEWCGKGRASIYFSREYIESEEGKELTCYEPTLEELIEACGEMKLEKKRDAPCEGKEVDTFTYEAYTNELSCIDATPEEAVANLWLLLNKKV